MTVKYRCRFGVGDRGARTWRGCALDSVARLLGAGTLDGEDTRAVKGSEWAIFVFKRVF